jgi:hypothetical protein
MKHKKVTLKLLQKVGACSEAVDEFTGSYKSIDSIELLEKMMRKRKDVRKYLEWANWLITKIMARKQYLAYAIYAAEQVLDICEKEHPGDDRPRKAIEAAKKVLKKDSQKNRTDAAYVAAYVADAATYAAYVAAYVADAVTYAADVAADAVTYAADVAADVATDAAYVAAYVAYAADAAADAATYAADAATYATYAATYAADAAADATADVAWVKTQRKILRYGIKLLKEGV